MSKKQKIYCYVDETGQDAGSKVFIVVAAVVKGKPEVVRLSLSKLERRLKIGNKKWHKSRHKDRINFISNFLEEKFNHLQIYFGRFKKPSPYFFPTFEVIQKSLEFYSQEPIEAIIYVDGQDSISAKKMTNALRSKRLHLNLVKGLRDETEVLIRLADRWAGCLRLAFLGDDECRDLVTKAKNISLLKEI